MKLRFSFLIKFFLLALSVYLGSYIIFISWNILEWPTWYRAALAIAFVVGVAGYVLDEGDDGYPKQFWKNNLEIITAYTNNESIKYRLKGHDEWHFPGEAHLFKPDRVYQLVNPEKKETKENAQQTDTSNSGDQ